MKPQRKPQRKKPRFTVAVDYKNMRKPYRQPRNDEHPAYLRIPRDCYDLTCSECQLCRSHDEFLYPTTYY